MRYKILSLLYKDIFKLDKLKFQIVKEFGSIMLQLGEKLDFKIKKFQLKILNPFRIMEYQELALYFKKIDIPWHLIMIAEFVLFSKNAVSLKQILFHGRIIIMMVNFEI
jgi:hypothetical protein